MALYQFGNQFSFTTLNPGPRSSRPLEGVTEIKPQIDFNLPTSQQLSDVQGQTKLFFGDQPTLPIEVREFVEPGFHYLDVGMEQYFSDIRIPSKDAVRFMRVQIAGMKRGIEAWSADLKHGRVALPVMSISRGSHEYNPEKFSPPHHAMRKIHTDRGRHRVRMVWRTSPWLVGYKLSIWAEFKRDAEHAINQILTRFNPLAEFRTGDDHTNGTVTIRYGGCEDASDKEATQEQSAKVKYEITITAEAWLSLPEQIVPSILGIYGGVGVGKELVPWDHLRVE